MAIPHHTPLGDLLVLGVRAEWGKKVGISWMAG